MTRVAHYCCISCLSDVHGNLMRIDYPLCPECGGEMVEVSAAVEALAEVWSETQPGVAGDAAREGASNTFHSVSN